MSFTLSELMKGFKTKPKKGGIDSTTLPLSSQSQSTAGAVKCAQSESAIVDPNEGTGKRKRILSAVEDGSTSAGSHEATRQELGSFPQSVNPQLYSPYSQLPLSRIKSL
jgi:hypothetical protein